MTSYGLTTCGACAATTPVLLADSGLSGCRWAADPFKTSGWTECPDCGKSYCPQHSTQGVCVLCLSGSDQPLAAPHGVSFDLQLTADECQAIVNVLGHVGGDPRRSQRRFADAVSTKLRRLGFYSQCGNVVKGRLDFEHDRHLQHVFPPGVRS